MRGELLLHCCCAPDGTVPQEILAREGWEVTLHFFGGNIHPREEYLRRAEAVLALGRARGVPVVLDPYEPEAWFVAVAPWAEEPEGGRRCLRCFALQLAAAGAAAVRRSCGAICTSLTISPHKDPKVINALGERVAASFGLAWEPRVWRRGGGFARSVEESKRLGLYRQNYCGCAYSRRKTSSGGLEGAFPFTPGGF
ncbi:MAG TPA: epoxyqueuosine reductase QueH [Synergistaceae bacterium]|nr:epoxyqueuosine reductase QueH [Synergistaceae bacterium]HQK24628.1 epoxyqueuosine reductase QueH [Synergistaceae bacterium]